MVKIPDYVRRPGASSITFKELLTQQLTKESQATLNKLGKRKNIRKGSPRIKQERLTEKNVENPEKRNSIHISNDHNRFANPVYSQ